MLRRLLKRVIRRMAPRVPGAAPTGRVPPTTRAGWKDSSLPPKPPPIRPASPRETMPEEEPPEVDVDAATVASWMAEDAALLLVDIREPHEVAHGHAAGALLLPMNTVPQSLSSLPKDRRIVVYCAAGVRSHSVTHWLRQQGYDDTWSLAGSVHGLVDIGATTLVHPGR